MAECMDDEAESKAKRLSLLFDSEVSWCGNESNCEEQLIEMEVIESMFPLEMELFSSSKDNLNCRNSFQLAVHVELPHQSVLLELWASATDEENCSIVNTASTNRPEDERPVFNRSVSGNRLTTSLLVCHLTPVMLTVVFPETYPSSSSPIFKISCLWLSPNQLRAIAVQLENMHKELKGEQIIYTWVNRLQTELFEALALDNIMITENYDFSSDERVSTEETDPFSRFAEVVSYDFAMLEKEFVTEQQTCMICYNEEVGANFARLVPCLHHYCIDCITEYCVMHVEEGTIGQLRCPEDDCKNTISPDVLQRVLGDEQYMRWERLMVQRTLEQMGDVVWCPRCSNPVVRDENDESLGLCGVCSFSFCTECNHMWHPGELCKELRTEENRKLIKTQRAQADAAAGPTNQDLRAAREEMYRRFQERQVSVDHNHAGKNVKTCPHCKIKVEKISGCNKMTCRCGGYFCWICGKKITGYDHFKPGGCSTFSGGIVTPAIGMRNVNFHDGYVAYRAALMNNQRIERKTCPRCRNRNVKTGRLNLIKCWFCKGHYCFQCGENLSKLNVPTSHYTTSKACSQHSD